MTANGSEGKNPNLSERQSYLRRSKEAAAPLPGAATRLQEAAKETPGILSVVPGRPPIEFIEAAKLDPANIQQCVAAGLLVHDEGGLVFRHELSRRAIESSLGALKQRQLHIQALAIMKRLGASAARQLHHAIMAEQVEEILRLAPSAADEASALGAHHEAAAALRKLLDHETTLDPADAALAERKLGFEVHVLGQIDEAIRYTRRALDIASDLNDLALAGELKAFLSRLAYLGGDRATSLDWGWQAVDMLERRKRAPGWPSLTPTLPSLRCWRTTHSPLTNGAPKPSNWPRNSAAQT